MSNDIPSARRDEIAARLNAGRQVTSSTLAAEFEVSEDAIRRDLRALAAAGLCRRVYGGALPLTPGTAPVADRQDANVARKREVARAAMPAIKVGSFIYLDNGSTNLVVAEELPFERDLIVATSSIEIASILARRGDVQIHMIGGEYNPVIGGSIDGNALATIERLNIDICFLGVCGLSATGGVSAFDASDAALKRALVARSRRTIILTTNEKIGQQAHHRIASLDMIDRVVVEHDAPDHMTEELRQAGATIIRASASSAQAS